MIRKCIAKLLGQDKQIERELLRFARIEYAKENPDYVLNMIYAKHLFKN
jgi:hypothetical protein